MKNNKLIKIILRIVLLVGTTISLFFVPWVLVRAWLTPLPDTPNFWSNPPDSSREAVELVLDQPADFEPDKKYKYSNTNYLLISDLIEKVLGTSKFNYILEEILNPLELINNTTGDIIGI